MRFLESPPIPDGRVCLCAISGGQAYILQALEKLGIDVIQIPAHPALAPPVSAHSDLLLHDLGGGRVLVAPGQRELEDSLRRRGFAVIVCEQPLSPRYPGDILLNCFALGGAVYGHTAHLSAELLRDYRTKGLHTVSVEQGYARCATCIVNDHAIITADPSIARAAGSNGVDVLLIQPGHCLLPGYDYGFIGGCSGLLGKQLLAFTGDINGHPDSARIRDFCVLQNVGIACLTDGPLLDIGGIIPLGLDEL